MATVGVGFASVSHLQHCDRNKRASKVYVYAQHDEVSRRERARERDRDREPVHKIRKTEKCTFLAVASKR